MTEVLKIILIILLSSVKFVFGPGFAYYDQKYNFTLFEAILYPIVGGMLGVFVFSFFSDKVALAWYWTKHKIKSAVRKRQTFSEPTVDTEGNITVNYSYVEKNQIHEKKIFSRRSRRIVRIWKKYGLIGIAFLTPVILSIPIGTIVASRLINNKKKVFLYLFVSITFWSVAMVSIFELYHVYSLKALQKEVLHP